MMRHFPERKESKVCLVTGGNRGIGRAITHSLAQNGCTVIFTSRDRNEGEMVRNEICLQTGNNQIYAEHLDLKYHTSIISLCRNLESRFSKLDVVINNSGIFHPVYEETPEGIEIQLAVNYFGTVLVTEELKALLQASGGGRVINTSSNFHRIGNLAFMKRNKKELYNPVLAYAQTKVAVMMHTLEAARRNSGTNLSFNCYHPGAINTNIANKRIYGFFWNAARPFMDTCESAAKTAVFLAMHPSLKGVTGKYYAMLSERNPSSFACNLVKSSELWDWTYRIIHERIDG